MAISAPQYQILRQLQPMLPRGGSLLEIGEANWYGDIDPRPLFPCERPDNWFAVAKDFYADLFAPELIVSIDCNGSPAAIRHDLNAPFPSEWEWDKDHRRFDLIINHGTAEHIFNIAQVFASMHGACEAGGLMIHESPFTGWIDHGFYCLQPTLFYDLAAANNYEVVRVFITDIKAASVLPVESRDDVSRLAKAGQIPMNAMLFVVLRKLFECPFRLPTQGYYAGALSAEGREAWGVMR